MIENSSIAVRGSLHKDSVFGKRTPPNLETGYHMRKSLAAINTLSQIDKIVDSRVKLAVLKTLDDAGISESTNFIPKNVFFILGETEGWSLRSSYLMQMEILFLSKR